MSYEKVKSIRLVNDENGWYAIITSATNNITPRYYTKWNYFKDKGLTKEQLQAEILLDFYYGNFHGGTSTKYGKFLQFLGGHWGCINNHSKACQIYYLYENIKTIIRNKFTNKDGHIVGEDRKICYSIIGKINQKQSEQVKRALYKEFQEFKIACKPTIVRIWKNNKPLGKYVYKLTRNKKGVYFTESYKEATVFTNTVKLTYIKRLLENNGYKAEFIKV